MVSAWTVTTQRQWQVLLNTHANYVSHHSLKDLYHLAVNQCLVYSLIADSSSCHKLLLHQLWNAILACNRSTALHFLQGALNPDRIVLRFCYVCKVAVASSFDLLDSLKEWFNILGNALISFLAEG